MGGGGERETYIKILYQGIQSVNIWMQMCNCNPYIVCNFSSALCLLHAMGLQFYNCTFVYTASYSKSNCFLSSYKPHRLHIIKYKIEVKWEGPR